MSAKFIKVKDTITPDLKRKARAVKNKRPLLLAMGTAVKGLGEQAFTDANKRPSLWAPHKDPKQTNPLLMGAPTPTLKNTLVVRVDDKRAVISSDRPYAAIHQLGGKHIPARPYLPFSKGGKLTAEGNKRATNALKAALRKEGL